jgi:hypothetical protein
LVEAAALTMQTETPEMDDEQEGSARLLLLDGRSRLRLLA